MALARPPTPCDNPDTMDRHLTVREAARELGVSSRTVERRIASGRLASVIVGGRRLVVAHPGWDTDTPTDSAATDSADNASVPDGKASWAVADRHRWPDRTDHQPDTTDRQADNADTVEDLQLRLIGAEARAQSAEERESRLIDAVREQSQTIRVLTTRLAQVEGRVIAPGGYPEMPREPSQPVEGTATPSPRPRGLRALYRAWRGR